MAWNWVGTKHQLFWKNINFDENYQYTVNQIKSNVEKFDSLQKTVYGQLLNAYKY